MRRLILGVVGFSIFSGVYLMTPAVARVSAAAEWAIPTKKLAKSVFYLENKEGACTAFSINQEKNYVLTAAHCEGPDMYVDQIPARIVSKDTKKDLMVLEVKDLNRPALALASENPKIGDEVISFGYGYALERPMMRVAHVSDDDTYIPEDGIGGPLIVIDAAFVGGMSGGPIINQAGEVVMIVQRASSVMGIGVGAETIRSKVGRFWGAPKTPKP